VDGAKITIDGRSEPGWVTPCTIPNLPAGAHSVVVSREGYSDAQESVTVEGGRTATVRPTLTVPSGEINIVTNPPGIEVFIDGQAVGLSPARKTLGVGQHTYALRQAGKDIFSSAFEIRYDGQMLTKKVDLGGGPAVPTGIVEVRTIPPGATVYADGKAVGGTTPTSLRLSAGRHTLTLSLSGYRPLQKEVDLPADGSIVINEKFSPQ
jgi:hypothetical protein